MMLSRLSRRAIADWPAWWALLAALELPAMSYSGYPPAALEYLLMLVGAGAVAVPMAFLGRLPFLGNILLVAGVSVFVLAYFYLYLASYGLIALNIGVLAAVGLLALLKFDRRAAVLTIIVACGSQVLVAAASTSPHIISEKQQEVARSNLPPVVHIILDEHPGIDAIPQDPKLSELQAALENQYLKAGFTVFPRAYSAENETQLSLPRLFNRNVTNPGDLVKTSRGSTRHEIQRAGLLEEIGKHRALELTQFDYTVFGQEVAEMPHVARSKIVNTYNYYPGAGQSDLSPSSRVQIAGAAALNWLYFWSKLPPIVWFFEQTHYGQVVFDWMFLPRWSYPLVARATLLDFSRNLDCCSQRGTYYFLHTYFPHMPYLYDRECHARSPREWKAVWSAPLERKNVAPYDRYVGLYQAALEQALCASKSVTSLVAALDRRPETKDAIVIVHGDHGSRISMKTSAGTPPGYDDKQEQRDQYGTLLAIRWPDTTPRIEPKDLRIDAVFAALVEQNFQPFNIDSVTHHRGLPFDD